MTILATLQGIQALQEQEREKAQREANEFAEKVQAASRTVQAEMIQELAECGVWADLKPYTTFRATDYDNRFGVTLQAVVSFPDCEKIAIDRKGMVVRVDGLMGTRKLHQLAEAVQAAEELWQERKTAVLNRLNSIAPSYPSAAVNNMLAQIDWQKYAPEQAERVAQLQRDYTERVMRDDAYRMAQNELTAQLNENYGAAVQAYYAECEAVAQFNHDLLEEICATVPKVSLLRVTYATAVDSDGEGGTEAAYAVDQTGDNEFVVCERGELITTTIYTLVKVATVTVSPSQIGYDAPRVRAIGHGLDYEFIRYSPKWTAADFAEFRAKFPAFKECPTEPMQVEPSEAETTALASIKYDAMKAKA